MTVELLGPDSRPLSANVRNAARLQAARNRQMAATVSGEAVTRAAYQGASYDHPSFAGWKAGNYSGQSALSVSRSTLVDRLNDVARNDGWGAAGTSRLVDNIIGAGWKLAARPNHTTLNLTDSLSYSIRIVNRSNAATTARELLAGLPRLVTRRLAR